MEEYLIFAVIGGLIFLTIFVKSMSEAYEQRQREKRIRIFQIKQGIDEITDLLERVKELNISKDLKELLSNEIMLRLQTIQRLDRKFHGLNDLIAEANERSSNETSTESITTVRNENDLKRVMITVKRLLYRLKNSKWYSKMTPETIRQHMMDVKVLRIEKIFQYYSDLANEAAAKENYMIAKEHYNFIQHNLASSGCRNHPRTLELQEQVEFMLKQTNENMTKKLYRDMVGENIEEEKIQENLQGSAKQNSNKSKPSSSNEKPS